MQVIMAEEDLKSVIMPMISRTVKRIVQLHTQGEMVDWKLEAVHDFATTSMVSEEQLPLEKLQGKDAAEIESLLMDFAEKNYATKQKQLSDTDQMLEFEKVVILRVVDERWTDHIDAMDQLRNSIGLRGYGQMNPLVEYQEEGYRMFEEMISSIDYDTTRLFMKAEIRQNIRR